MGVAWRGTHIRFAPVTPPPRLRALYAGAGHDVRFLRLASLAGITRFTCCDRRESTDAAFVLGLDRAMAGAMLPFASACGARRTFGTRLGRKVTYHMDCSLPVSTWRLASRAYDALLVGRYDPCVTVIPLLRTGALFVGMGPDAGASGGGVCGQLDRSEALRLRFRAFWLVTHSGAVLECRTWGEFRTLQRADHEAAEGRRAPPRVPG